jgi:opacity protein-like surface antigen
MTMNAFYKTIVAGLLASAISLPAFAADLSPMETTVAAPVSTSGFYVGSLSSVNFLDDTDFDALGSSISTDYDVGYYSSLRAGYKFDPMGFFTPRVELELGYGNASVDEHSVSGVGGVGGIDSYGDARSFQGYVNGYLDIPVSSDGFMSAITPYVGGGVGFMNLELRKQGVGGVGTLMDDSDTQFAYHLDAGVGINLQGIGLFTNTSLFDNTTLDIGYRFTAADDFDFTARDGTSSSTDFRSNAVTFGLRKQF